MYQVFRVLIQVALNRNVLISDIGVYTEQPGVVYMECTISTVEYCQLSLY